MVIRLPVRRSPMTVLTVSCGLIRVRGAARGEAGVTVAVSADKVAQVRAEAKSRMLVRRVFIREGVAINGGLMEEHSVEETIRKKQSFEKAKPQSFGVQSPSVVRH